MSEIYSSVPNEILEDKSLDARRDVILEYLNTSDEPKTARNIATECGYPTRGTQVEVRKAITQLIEIDKMPIISVAKGFMVATCANQMNNYAERLTERCQGILRRAKACREIANGMSD